MEVILLEVALLSDIALELADGDADLLHGVTVTDGDAVVSRGILVAHGLEVHSDAQRRTDLILTAVTLADRRPFQFPPRAPYTYAFARFRRR